MLLVRVDVLTVVRQAFWCLILITVAIVEEVEAGDYSLCLPHKVVIGGRLLADHAIALAQLGAMRPAYILRACLGPLLPAKRPTIVFLLSFELLWKGVSWSDVVRVCRHKSRGCAISHLTCGQQHLADFFFAFSRLLDFLSFPFTVAGQYLALNCEVFVFEDVARLE